MHHLTALLTLLLTLVACAGYGAALLRMLRVEGRYGALQSLLALALGMGSLAYLVLAAGLLGLLHPPVLGGLVVAGWILAALCRRALRTSPPSKASPPIDVILADRVAPSAAQRGDAVGPRKSGKGSVAAHSSRMGGQGAERSGRSNPAHADDARNRFESSLDPDAESDPRREHLLARLLLGFAGLLGILTLLGALRPVDGLDWDSLSYHLAAPKIYLRQGRIPFIEYDSHTHFPFTMEMLYTLGLQFGGVGGAKLFHWAAGWLTAVVVGVTASRLTVGGRRAPRWVGPLAATLFAAMPVVLWEMGTAYVDLGTALFQILALAVLVEAHQREEGIRPEDAVLAGILSGFALGTKMTALLQFGLLGLGLLWLAARSAAADPRARRNAVRVVVVFGLAGVLVGSPWYIKSWIWTHNPVYPFFFSLFPHSYSWTKEAADAYASEQSSFGMGRGPLALLLSLWNMAVHGRDFYMNLRVLTGDQIGSISPVWAGLLPLLLWTRGLDRRARPYLLYFGGSMALWFVLSHQSRYLIPIFAALAVVLAAGVAALESRTVRLAAGAFIALSLGLSLRLHLPLATTALQVVNGSFTEEQYLHSSLPGLHEATQYVNQLPSDSRVALYQETRGFYLDRDYFWANPLQHNLIPYDRLENGTALVAELRKHRITHVLINHQFVRGVEESRWYQLLAGAIREGKLEEVFRSRGAEIGRRGVIVYQLR